MTDTPPVMTTPTQQSGGLVSPVTPDPVGTPDRSYVEFFKGCFQPYANFDGRARRKEYGSFVAGYFIIIIGLSILSTIFGIMGGGHGNLITGLLRGLVSVAMLIVIFGSLVPAIGVTIRRVHDIGLPAWVAIIAIVFNWVGVLVLLFVPSQEGANIYGGYPKPVT